jgi:hypothetical protein
MLLEQKRNAPLPSLRGTANSACGTKQADDLSARIGAPGGVGILGIRQK